MNIRLKVIEDAIQMEEMIAHNICAVIGIKPGTSKLFGSTSAALPFSAKIDLLQEVQYFDNEAKQKLLMLAQIRNKFAHMSSVNNYTTCFERLAGAVKKLEKWYPKTKIADFDTNERYFFGLYYALLTDVFEEVARFNKFIYDKVKEDYEIDSKLRWYEEYMMQLKKVGESNPKFTRLLAKAEDETNNTIDAMIPIPRSKWLDYLFEGNSLGPDKQIVKKS